MTNTQVDNANLVVVDGSNIATEGRSVPSLAQLNDAVLALTSEFPDITVTVVVDATFGHRIDKSEVAEFDEAVAHNELVTPPAGAIGRGDAFVLSIANKVGARIFSNDSFQEFHGVYPWLFDEGRLIGGKPVPHVGWVFVNRVPVKGPLSRKARGAGRDGGASRREASKLASLPMPVPTSPPPRSAVKAAEAAQPTAAAASAGAGRGRRRRGADNADGAEAVPAAGKEAVAATPAAAPVSGGPVNDLLPFLDFVQHHGVGTAVTGVVESYSSHGAYVKIGDVRGYVPLRLMGMPPPRSAREVMRLGDSVPLVVASFAPPRRSIDLAVPGVGEAPAAAAEEPAPKRRGRKAESPAEAAAATTASPTESRGRRRGKVADVLASEDVSAEAAAAETAEAPAKPSRRRAKPSAAEKVPAVTASADATSTVGTELPGPTKKAPAKKAAAAKKVAAKKAAEKAPARTDAAAKKAPAKKAAARQEAEPARATKRTARAASTRSGRSDLSAAESAPAARRRRAATAATSDAVEPAGKTEPSKRRQAKQRPSSDQQPGPGSSPGSSPEPAPRRGRRTPQSGE